MEIRAIAPAELDPFLEALLHAFGVAVMDEDEVRGDRERLEPDRCVAAIDDGQLVSVGGAFSWRTIAPGGGEVGTAGITTIGTLPTHRRRGLLSRLMTWLLDQAEEREEPLSTLFASEAAIYGRFGFGRATACLGLDVLTHRAAFHGHTAAGEVRLRSRDDVAPLLGELYHRTFGTRPGAIVLHEADVAWLFEESTDPKKKPFYAVHHDEAGEPDGVAIYRVADKWKRGIPEFEATVLHLLGATPSATADLWRYLLDLDLVARMKTRDRPVDEPLQWLVREHRAIRATLFDGLLARPVRTEWALAARGYATDDRLRLDVQDAFRPHNAGTFELTAEGGEVSCTRTRTRPDLRCSVREIGALFLGGATWRELAEAGLVTEVATGALARADLMWRTPRPPFAPFVF